MCLLLYSISYRGFKSSCLKVLKYFPTFTAKHLHQSVTLRKPFLLNTSAQMLLCFVFCKMFVQAHWSRDVNISFFWPCLINKVKIKSVCQTICFIKTALLQIWLYSYRIFFSKCWVSNKRRPLIKLTLLTFIPE